ncbi:MAG: hypothetical protein CM15mP103_08470 [Gammaproteobacteria bacterium]|nr:MAG: hypothetical protein CM15mP103_08470 [Gammaproteobacteria bacterium]
MINLSHFAIFDVNGCRSRALLEFCSVAKVGTDTPVSKGVLPHFLDSAGGIHSDLAIVRLAEDGRVMRGGAPRIHRDYVWMKRMVDKMGLTQVEFVDRTEQIATLGLWGPEARATIQKLMDFVAFPMRTSLRDRQRDQRSGHDDLGLPHLLCRRAGLGAVLPVR